MARNKKVPLVIHPIAKSETEKQLAAMSAQLTAMKPQKDEWLDYYRVGMVGAFSIIVAMLGYFGTWTIGNQTDLARALADIKVIIQGVDDRGKQNRDDIKDIKRKLNE
jgi:hypothetical protein